MGPNDGMGPGGPMPPGFFPVSLCASLCRDFLFISIFIYAVICDIWIWFICVYIYMCVRGVFKRPFDTGGSCVFVFSLYSSCLKFVELYETITTYASIFPTVPTLPTPSTANVDKPSKNY